MKTIPVSLIVAGLLVPVIAKAQPQEEPKGGPGGDGENWRERQRQFAETWKAADKDGDGFISREEFDAMPRIGKLPEDKRPQIFERLDKNADGKLGREELKRTGKPHDGQRPHLPRLWELDSDKSGGVSFVELKAGRMFQKLPAARQAEIFQRLDSDRDGQITPKDRPQAPLRPDGDKSHPRHGPGKPGEWPDPRRIIRQLDQNGDSSLSFEEFRAGPMVRDLSEDEQEDRFETLDKNHDQKLTSEDFPPPPPHAGPEGGKPPQP
jgi:Ca2+-binding EF-hand superfamily protein